jgi:3-dehydroquinate dehydratase-1
MAAPPKICVPIVSDSQTISSIEPLVDFYEVRIDLIGKDWRKVIPQLKKPWIACNRRVEEGGQWQENENKRLKELLSALEIGAGFIDIELGTPDIGKVVQEVKGHAELIVSSHYFTDTPPIDRLHQVVLNELEAGADICKVVTTARDLKDNAVVLELIRIFPGVKIIAFAMGVAGQISRLLSPLAGGYFTWASSEEGRESAGGQMPVEYIRKIYRMLEAR